MDHLFSSSSGSSESERMSESAGLEPDIRALARALEAMHGSSVSLSSDRKKMIRAHVLQRIALHEQQRAVGESLVLDRMIAWMKQVASGVSLSSLARMRIRERLVLLFDDVSAPLLFHRVGLSPWTAWKRLSATILAASFSLFIVFAFVLQVPVTFAQERAVIQEVFGDATVMRDGGVLSVQKGFELREGDVLETAGASKVSVMYFDRSFSRFFEGSRAIFQRLVSNDFGTEHSVDVVLQKGSVWSNIFDFVSNSQFRVQTSDLVTLASQRATFSMTANDGESALEVYDHAVQVELASQKEQRTIDRGFSVLTNRHGDTVRPLHLESVKQAWVSENMAQDRKLLAENEQHMQGVVAGPSNALEENASLLLAFDAGEKFRLQLSIAERRFYASLKEEPFDAVKHQADFQTLDVLAKSAPVNDTVSKKLAEASMTAAFAAQNVLLAQSKSDAADDDVRSVAADAADADIIATKDGRQNAQQNLPQSAEQDVAPSISGSVRKETVPLVVPSVSVAPSVSSASSAVQSHEEKPVEERPVTLPPKLQLSQE